MRIVQLVRIKQMELAIADMPKIKNGNEVLLKVKSVGVCGSDVHYYSDGKIGSQVVSFPFIVGHECSAEVVEVGRDVQNLKIGNLVVIEPSVACGVCDQCLAGRPHTCRNVKFLGCPGQLSGCFSDYIVMPESNCLEVTGYLTPVQAALIEPLSIGIYAVRLAEISNSSLAVCIFGAGPIGLSVLLKLLVDNITNVGMVDPLDYRLKKADEIGTHYIINPTHEDVAKRVKNEEENYIDVVFEASGEQEAIENAARILKPGGKLVLIGIPSSAEFKFNMDIMRRKEIIIINVRRQNHCVDEAIRLVKSGKVNVDKMVTHHFTLEETPKAFDMVEGYIDGVIKAVVNF